MLLKNSVLYADTKYQYYYGEIESGPDYVFDGPCERTFYCTEGYATIDAIKITAGDTIDVKNRKFIVYGKAKFYIAQAPSIDNTPYTEFTGRGDHYKVTKPWGYELWLNGEHPRYAFKVIHITAGNQCSLQYHNFKEETIVMYKGIASWIYKSNDLVDNDNVTIDDLDSEPFIAGQFHHVTPKTLHRVRAVTDITMLEVSTPYLDDVIRVQDDRGRPNGKIESEHKA